MVVPCPSMTVGPVFDKKVDNKELGEPVEALLVRRPGLHAPCVGRLACGSRVEQASNSASGPAAA